MDEILRQSELFRDLQEGTLAHLKTIAQPRTVRPGEYIFLLGDRADCLYIVRQGKVELCFPFSFGGTMRDVPIETKLPGGALGWSAFVEPYRFTLSARAAESGEVLAFGRQELLQACEADPRSGYAFMRRVAAMVGHRLLAVQALWARELQRAMTATRVGRPGAGDAPTGT